jgi:hypothetical protein
MKHRFLKTALAGAGLCGLLAGCATSVDWGGPLGHYRYSYDSRPTVHYDDTAPYRSTYNDPVVVERPTVTYYHHEDDDD